MNIEDLATKQDIQELKAFLVQALDYRAKGEMQKEWLRSKEVKKLLHISDGTLSNMRIKKLLNPTKIEGVYFYRLSEIMDLLNAGTE